MIIIVSNRNVKTVDPHSNDIEIGDENIVEDGFKHTRLPDLCRRDTRTGPKVKSS